MSVCAVVYVFPPPCTFRIATEFAETAYERASADAEEATAAAAQAVELARQAIEEEGAGNAETSEDKPRCVLPRRALMTF